MNNNNNNNLILYQKYKIHYKILENNNFYLEFLDNDQDKYYSTTFTPSQIVDIGKGVFTNAETFGSTIKRVFNMENCNSFELEKIKYNKEINSLVIILKIIVIEIAITLPRKTSYQNLEERVNQLSTEVVELKQRLQFLEKLIINNSIQNHNNNNNNNNHSSLNMNLLNLINSNNNNNKNHGHLSLSSSTPSTPIQTSSYSPYSSTPSTPSTPI